MSHSIFASNPRWKTADGGMLKQTIRRAWKSIAKEVYWHGVLGAETKLQEAEERLQAALLELGYQVSRRGTHSFGILKGIAYDLSEVSEEQIDKSIEYQLKYSLKVVNVEGALHKLSERLCRLAEEFVEKNAPIEAPHATAKVDMYDNSVRIEISNFAEAMEDLFYTNFDNVMTKAVNAWATQQGFTPRDMYSDFDDYKGALIFSFRFSD